MIRASIIGATGYVGFELTRLLLAHPDAQIAQLVSHGSAGQQMADIYPSFVGQSPLPLVELNIDGVIAASDVIFTSLPHGASGEVIPALVDGGARVIDMSGDFRYLDVEVYNKWYKTTHPRPDLLARAVYGMPEWHRDQIPGAQLVGNPGCYTTCSILALAPLLKAGLIDPAFISIDAKSGATGAGRAAKQELHTCELHDNMRAYNIGVHRHTSEIEQELSLAAGETIQVSFTPHILPINRGILATSIAKLAPGVGAQQLEHAYATYRDAPFVRVLPMGKLPELAHVVGSNYCYIGYAIDARLGRVVVVSALDNLIKGAAGQAIQNMNLMFGLNERAGLGQPAWYL